MKSFESSHVFFTYKPFVELLLFCSVCSQLYASFTCCFVCEGYPYDTEVCYSHQSSHKGWYVYYSMNYTGSINNDFCQRYQHLKYKTSRYKNEQKAVNVSLSMTKELTFKIYPTPTRDALNTIFLG